MSSKTSFDSVEKLIRELMLSQKYTDMVLCCQGKEFKVHRAIICTQSPVLAAACDGGFKVCISNLNRSLRNSALLTSWR